MRACVRACVCVCASFTLVDVSALSRRVGGLHISAIIIIIIIYACVAKFKEKEKHLFAMVITLRGLQEANCKHQECAVACGMFPDLRVC